MANTQTNKKAFSIENFKELFEKSGMKEYLPEEDLREIERAIEDRDEVLLSHLYESLLKEQEAEAEILRNFEETKNDIVDDFMVEAIEIKKKFVEKPRKEAAKKAEEEEKARAEELLKKL